MGKTKKIASLDGVVNSEQLVLLILKKLERKDARLSEKLSYNYLSLFYSVFT
jgi:hypothetical protein